MTVLFSSLARKLSCFLLHLDPLPACDGGWIYSIRGGSFTDFPIKLSLRLHKLAIHAPSLSVIGRLVLQGHFLLPSAWAWARG